MRKLIKILPLFFLTALVVAGCDFGKAPNMDKVRDVLMEEYGDEVYGEEVMEEGAVVDEAKATTFSFDSECDDTECQQGFHDYMVLAWGENWESEVNEEMKMTEYEFYLELRAQLGLGGGSQ